jgi:hypothetical protein
MDNEKIESFNVWYDFTFQIHLWAKKITTMIVQILHLIVLSPRKDFFFMVPFMYV